MNTPQIDIFHTLLLREVKGIGDTNARNIIKEIGSPKSIFELSNQELKGFSRIGQAIIDVKEDTDLHDKIWQELEFCNNNEIKYLTYFDEEYPKRLKHCSDAPLALFYKGNADLNNNRVVSIVGTRRATSYGKQITHDIIDALSDLDVLVVSGLAFGIDIIAHKRSIHNNIPTVGVLGHGLDRLYPKEHLITAKKMVQNGGLLTEFMTQTNPDRENFPKRNRIVAGMTDATIVIESAKKGGSLITAKLANDYNRDVFAVPGKITDEYSSGCNWLIKTNQAHVIESVKDIEYIMGWQTEEKKDPVQKQLFVNLNDDEQSIVNSIKSGNISIDDIALSTSMPMSKISTDLLMMEFKGIVRQLPGKKYELA